MPRGCCDAMIAAARGFGASAPPPFCWGLQPRDPWWASSSPPRRSRISRHISSSDMRSGSASPSMPLLLSYGCAREAPRKGFCHDHLFPSHNLPSDSCAPQRSASRYPGRALHGPVLRRPVSRHQGQSVGSESSDCTSRHDQSFTHLPILLALARNRRHAKSGT